MSDLFGNEEKIEEAVAPIEKAVTKRAPKKVAEPEYDVNALQAKYLKEEEDAKKLEAIIDRESNYKMFLKNIDLEEIPSDGFSKKIVEQILASSQPSKDKVYDIERVIISAKLGSYLEKANSSKDEEILPSSKALLEKLSSIDKKDLTSSEIHSSENLFKTLDNEFTRIGRANIAQGIPDKSVESLNFQERLTFEHRKRIAEENARYASYSRK